LDGKKLISKNGVRVYLKEDGEMNLCYTFVEPEDWEIYDGLEMEPASWAVQNDGTIDKDNQ